MHCFDKNVQLALRRDNHVAPAEVPAAPAARFAAPVLPGGGRARQQCDSPEYAQRLCRNRQADLGGDHGRTRHSLGTPREQNDSRRYCRHTGCRRRDDDDHFR